MMPTRHRLDELADALSSGAAFTRAHAELMLAETDLVRIGMLGDGARRRRTGDEVTFGRVCVLDGSAAPAERGEAQEVRLVGAPASFEDAVARVRHAVLVAAGVDVTGFSLVDLLELAGHDHLVLAEMAGALRAEGLAAVAETPVDRLGSTEQAVEIVRAVRHGGLETWRLTVDRAAAAERLDLIERAAEIQRHTGAILAFAPLPRQDPAGEPSTGYDDVRTIAVARLFCGGIGRIQVDWPLHGPKLAQVAITYGADDVDGIAAVDTLNLGPRRAPAEDIARQIRAAGAVPVERDARYQVRG